MTYNVFGGTLNFTQSNPIQSSLSFWNEATYLKSKTIALSFDNCPMFSSNLVKLGLCAPKTDKKSTVSSVSQLLGKLEQYGPHWSWDFENPLPVKLFDSQLRIRMQK